MENSKMVIEGYSRAMCRNLFFYISLTAAALPCTISTSAQPANIPAILSTDSLVQQLRDPRLVVLDIRTPEFYKKGHIPGSINVPLNLWAVSQNGLALELPSDDSLHELVGKSGIDAHSHVVVVNRIDTDFSRTDPARVAWTLHVAGVENVSVLDGGYNRWVKEKKPISTDDVKAKSGSFIGKIDRSSFALKAYVLKKLDKSTIVDSRTPEDYFGITSQPGHIRNSMNLPAPWMFEGDGTFRKESDLAAMVSGVLGTNKSREVILYCGVGGYASAWWFVLTQILGYRNVKVYDGSMEEWLRDPSAPVTTYSWH